MVLDLINNRRSIRKYTSQVITEDQIKDILAAGMMAPTARNIQEWRFIVVENRKVLEELGTKNPYAAMTKEAVFSIIVCGEKGLNDRYIECDAGAAIENMMLQAQSMGIGSCWCALMSNTEREDIYRSVIDIPDNYVTVAAVQFGYPAETRVVENRYDEKKVIFIK